MGERLQDNYLAELTQGKIKWLESQSFIDWEAHFDSYYLLALDLHIHLIQVGTGTIYLRRYKVEAGGFAKIENTVPPTQMKISEFEKNLKGCKVPKGKKGKTPLTKWLLDWALCPYKARAEMGGKEEDVFNLSTGLRYDGESIVIHEASTCPIVRYLLRIQLQTTIRALAQQRTGQPYLPVRLKVNHEETWEYLNRMYKENEAAGRSSSSGMSPLARVLNRLYSVRGREKKQFPYKLRQKMWVYNNPNKKLSVITWVLGSEGAGKTLILGDWDGAVMWGKERETISTFQKSDANLHSSGRQKTEISLT